MRVSGFTIVRHAVTFGYPIAESLQSLLPLVDQLVVNVGDCDDGTWEAVQRLNDARIVAFRSTWDLTRREGLTLSEETNKALALCDGDWAIYLQADEVLHEEEAPAFRAALAKYRSGGVQALSLRYYHFYGSYQTYKDDPRHWYRRATRIIRTGVGIQSVGDACAFMRADDGDWRKPRRRDLDLHVFHYGRVRPPAQMLDKQRNLERFYLGETSRTQHGLPAEMSLAEVWGDDRHLRRFHGTHPAVMRERVESADWPAPRAEAGPWPPWMLRAYVYAAWMMSRIWRALRSR